MKTLGKLLLLLLPIIAQAQPAWDAAADFMPGENAANGWTWGWRYATGDVFPMVPGARCGIYIEGQGDIPGFDCFTAFDNGMPIPQVLKNNSGASVVFDPAGTTLSKMTLGQNALFLRIGYDWAGVQMYPVIRYTAPEAGAYDFLVSVQLVDKAAVSALMHMTGLPDKQIDGFGDAKHFQRVYPLKAGESVDIWATPIGNLFYSTTAVRASVLRVNP